MRGIRELIQREAGEKHLPYPEVIDEGKWEIREGEGTAVRSKRGPGGVVAVPTSSSDFDRARRIRALAAGKHSPQQWREVPEHISDEMLMIAETMRVGAITHVGLEELDRELFNSIRGYDKDGFYRDDDEMHLIAGATEVASVLIGPAVQSDLSGYVKTLAREAGLFDVDQIRYALNQMLDLDFALEFESMYGHFFQRDDPFRHLEVEEIVNPKTGSTKFRVTDSFCETCRDEFLVAQGEDDAKGMKDALDYERHIYHHMMREDERRQVDHLGGMKTITKMIDFMDQFNIAHRMIQRLSLTLKYSAKIGRESDGLDASDHRTSIQVAHILQQLIEDDERTSQKYNQDFDEKSAQKRDPGPTKPGSENSEGEEGDGELAEAEIPGGVSEEEYQRDIEDGLQWKDVFVASDDYDQPWGEMTLVKLTLDRLMPARLTAPTRRFSDRGVIPTAVHRWCTDKQIFATKRRAAGGSILIDVSGSMSLMNHEIYEMLEVIPAGIIGIYSARGSKGTLRIVAEGGRMVDRHVDFDYGPIKTRSDKMINYGGGNVIDGPSLMWLAEQQFPRVWISDGVVTGAEGDYTKNLVDDVEQICRKHKIVRVPGMNEALQMVEKYS